MDAFVDMVEVGVPDGEAVDGDPQEDQGEQGERLHTQGARRYQECYI